jgi:hypothetical protein
LFETHRGVRNDRMPLRRLRHQRTKHRANVIMNLPQMKRTGSTSSSEQLVRPRISDHLVVVPLTLEGVAARAPFNDVVTTGSVHGVVAPKPQMTSGPEVPLRCLLAQCR